MNTLITNDGVLDAVCRFCLNQELLTEITLIDGDISFQEKIYYCLGHKVQENDKLPSTICISCKNSIWQYYDFKQNCLQTLIQLKSHLNESSVVKKTIEIPNFSENKDKIKVWCDDKLAIEEAMCLNEIKKEDTQAITDVYQDNSPSIKSEIGELLDTNVQTKEINSEKLKTRFQCDLCGAILGGKRCLRQHLSSHKKNRSTCNICQKTFSRVGNRNEHVKSHLNIKPYVCDMCGKMIIRRGDLIRHMKVHSEIREFSCAKCGKKFKRSHDVQIHMRTHTGIRPYNCKICGKDYTSLSGYRKHYLKYCGNNLKQES